MAELDIYLQDQLLHLLDGSPRGMTVERLRSSLQLGGSITGKHNIVRALRALSERNLVEIDAARKWRTRRTLSGGVIGPGGDQPRSKESIVAVPCSAILGDRTPPEDAIPDGNVTASLDLLTGLLPYYQESLRAGDGGSPFETLARANDRFVLLRPDAPWWPSFTQGRLLRVPRHRLSGSFLSSLAKNAGKKLVLGYPMHAVKPPNDDTQPFFRPVTSFRCRFSLSDTHLDIVVPSMPPAIVEDWIRGQQKYGGWDAARLRSWLLLDDETSDLQDDDEMAAADFVEVPQLASRLSAAVGKDAHQKIDPVAVVESVPVNPKTGYYNALVLMVDGGGRYTRSAIGDYDILQTKGTQDFAATSLDAIFGGTGHKSMPIPIVHPFPLAENQLVAARSGVVGPLSVVTGPPGTGKSQVIAAIMLSAAAAGKSVLFAARQHRALDAVQERLHDVTGDRVLMVRANEADSWGGFNFLDALKGLQTRAGTQEGVPAFNRALARLKETDDKRWTLLARWQELHNITEAAASLSWRIEEVERKLLDSSQLLAAEQARPTSSCWRKCLDKFRAMLSLRPKVILIGQSWVRNQLERELAGLRQDLTVAEAKIASLRTPLEAAHENPASITDLVTELSKDLVLRLLDLLDNIAAKDRQALTEIIGDVALRGTHTLPSDAYRLILKHFPLWAVTTLAAGSRIPIVAGLFDYVIFDEAAQTDIASAIPLLFRAKTAVVVGDPMQLAMISNLDPKEERDLLQRYNLLRGGVGRFAQGRTNLFDLVSSCGTATRHILTDHYRCHPEIASYFNEAFYGRKLAALTDVNRLKIPRGYKAGLHWTDITGPIVARAGGTQSGSASSEAEAAAIIAQLKMLIDQNYAGTIGVVTFFDYQAKTIAGMADRAFGASALERHSVKVFTANKFQGDERDVMLLSLCLGASTPVGAKTFIQKERRLLNVAVSRARAICHIVGDLEYAAHSGIPHIEALVRKFRQAQNPRGASANDRFDSPWEKKLFDALIARGLSPTPQYPEGGRFLDLALINDRTAKKLDIEVDGVTFHTSADGYRLATDLWRDHQLKGLGWTILRFWVYELRDNMEKCLDRIEACYRS